MGRPAAPGIELCGNCRVLLKPYIRTMYVYPLPLVESLSAKDQAIKKLQIIQNKAINYPPISSVH